MGNLIRLNDVADKFTDHLNHPKNSRIILSGQFGIGKTRFLRTYFKEHENHFLCIHIFPVNYSIAKNEDILDLIKYDLIYELLDHEISIETFAFNKKEKATQFVIDNAPGIFEAFSTMIPHLDKSFSKFISKSRKLLGAYEKFSKDIDKGEDDLLKKLGEKVEGRRGSYYQNDFYTKFITEQLSELAERDREAGMPKQKILIIDDLDRIDPEQIFRLLNIFSAHFDITKPIRKKDSLEDIFFPEPAKNKFGFDKVIFVCDLNNIRRIFQHRYGPDVDFDGYMDKFYSNDIFEFDNRAAIRQWLSNILSILQPTNAQLNGMDIAFLEDTIVQMLNCKAINLRNLLKLDAQSMSHIFSGKTFRNESKFKRVYLTKIVKILTVITGNKASLRHSLNLCSTEFSKKTNPEYCAGNNSTEHYMAYYILPVTAYREHHFNDNTGVKNYYPGYSQGAAIQFSTQSVMSINYPSMILVNITQNTSGDYNRMIFPEFVKAVDILFEAEAI